MIVPVSDVTGLVLAGGLGRRMQSVDKGLVPFRERPLAAHGIERLRPQVGALLISANRHAGRYAAFGHPVIGDPLSVTGAGPLAGMFAGLVACGTGWLVTVPCDAPFLPTDLVERMTCAVDQADLAIARTAAGTHPVFCLMRSSLADRLARFLDGGGRRVGAWAVEAGAIEVCFDDEAAFRNLNTRDELQAAERNG